VGIPSQAVIGQHSKILFQFALPPDNHHLNLVTIEAIRWRRN
jgi:hypothetical protein